MTASDYLATFLNHEKDLVNFSPRPGYLERVRSVLMRLGSPQDRLRIIHIAGSKGKGSTAAFTANILREAGYTVGLYTSPHLYDVHERIRILKPGKITGLATKRIFPDCISERQFLKLIKKLRPELETARRHPVYGGLTYFEVLTILAVCFFNEQKTDWVVLETGLGGRLDATNVCQAAVSVITPISLEHTAQLGKTLTKIAAEKAAIIKNKESVVVVAPQKLVVLKVILARCRKIGVRPFIVGRDLNPNFVFKIVSRRLPSHKKMKTKGGFNPDKHDQIPSGFDQSALRADFSIEKSGLKTKLVAISSQGQSFMVGRDVFTTPLLGRHQVVNASVAIRVAKVLAIKGIAIQRGIAGTVWPLRFEVVSFGRGCHDKSIVLDGAHNPESCARLSKALREIFPRRKWVLIFGCSGDKDIHAMADVLAKNAQDIILTSARHPRAVVWDEYLARKYFSKQRPMMTGSVSAACRLAGKIAGNNSLIVVAGSLFVAAEARKEFSKAICQ